MLWQKKFEAVNVVGVMIGRSSPAQNHVGLLYQSDSGPRMLHLAWHYWLRNDDPNEEPWCDYLWVDLNFEDPENREALAAVLGNIWLSTQQNIPYGFSYEGEAFEADGSFVLPPMGRGLTCATFVIKALAHAGFQLLDLATWQGQKDDADWKDKIINSLKGRSGVSEDHLEGLRNDVNAMRVRPEHVVGAGMSAPWPVNFVDADVIAKEVLAELCEKITF